MRRIITLWALLFSFLLNAQIGFQERAINENSTGFDAMGNVQYADIDNDGDLDVISFREVSEKVVWYENVDGNGLFSFAKIVNSNATNVNWIYPADFDSDGDIDIVASLDSVNRIEWYENTNGLGNFQNVHTITSGIIKTKKLFASDFDGDGDMDLATISTLLAGNLNIFSWFENMDGQGNFGEQEIIYDQFVTTNNFQIYGQDMDGDGDTDILYSSWQDIIIGWFENTDGQGSFNSNHIIESVVRPVNLHFGDIDTDGDTDVIATSGDDDSLNWYENLDGQGNFGSRNIINNYSSSVRAVYLSDMDTDNDLDIAFVVNNDIIWKENSNGLGVFTTERFISENNLSIKQILMVDIDGENANDVIVVSNTPSNYILSWFESTDNIGGYGIKQIIETSGTPTLYIGTDIDGDSGVDLLFFSSEFVGWYKNYGGSQAFKTQKTIYSEGEGFIPGTNICVGDMDNDGFRDIITSVEGGHLGWYKNIDGTGDLIPNEIDTEPTYITLIEVNDIDFDGDLDIFVIKDNSNKFSWFENLDGSGNFGSEQIIMENFNPSEWDKLHFVDFDNDSDMDIIYGSTGLDQILWFENIDGLGSFSAAQVLFEDGNSLDNFDFGDIDGDADYDILLRYDSQDFYWLENLNGTGSFSEPIFIASFSVGNGNPSLSDIDSDGDLDIVFQNNFEIKFLENLSSGIFSSEQILIQSASLMVRYDIVDINNDGRLDIIPAIANESLWFENMGILGNEIYGNVKVDSNENGCDETDNSYANLMIITDNGANSFSTFTNSNGDYFLNVNEGDFTTELSAFIPSYYNSSPTFHLSNFIGLGNIDEANFCLEPSGIIDDLNVTLYPLTDALPGFDSSYQLVYKNVGTTVLSGTVDLVFDDSKLSFLDASEPVAAQTINSVIFDYADLVPFEFRAITVNFNVAAPPTTDIGDILVFEATVNPVVGDETEENNVFELQQTVVGSYDPNDIQVLEGDEIYLEQVDDYLHYIIRFQNTGTASAINVKVTNELDSNLDWTTMQLENISHSNRVEITDGTMVEFIFENINLPDATTNEPESHGYIQYKIKPISTVDIGDSMSNNANIYFDFNPPILTNTVTTTVIENLGTEDYTFNSLKLHPNPSNDLVNIESNQSITGLEVINQLGQAILGIQKQEGINSFSVENFSTGIYFVKLIDEKSNSVVKKLVKN